MLPDFGIHREIQKLDVYCANKEYGCKQTMPWLKLKVLAPKCIGRIS